MRFEARVLSSPNLKLGFKARVPWSPSLKLGLESRVPMSLNPKLGLESRVRTRVLGLWTRVGLEYHRIRVRLES